MKLGVADRVGRWALSGRELVCDMGLMIDGVYAAIRPTTGREVKTAAYLDKSRIIQPKLLGAIFC